MKMLKRQPTGWHQLKGIDYHNIEMNAAFLSQHLPIKILDDDYMGVILVRREDKAFALDLFGTEENLDFTIGWFRVRGTDVRNRDECIAFAKMTGYYKGTVQDVKERYKTLPDEFGGYV